MLMHNRNSSRWMKHSALVVVTTCFLTLPYEVSGQQNQVALPATDATQAIASLKHKIDSIIIDKVNFNKADISDVIQFLQKKSKELDPDKVGVNFVLRLDAPKSHIHREFTMILDNVPLNEVLLYITEQTNLQYYIEEYAVYLRPGLEESQTLTVRTYLVPAHFFKVPPDASGNVASSETGLVDVREQLVHDGIHFPSGTSAFFLPEKDKVVVRNTPEQLDRMANLIEQLSDPLTH
jgi:general secretion pathway protein D